MTRPLSWQAVAKQLAMQLSVHAFCGEHPVSDPGAECPFCADRAAYQVYLDRGGRDYRPVTPAGAVSVPLHEVPRTPVYDTGVEAYCLAHRRRVTWLPLPGWWIHVKDMRLLDRLDGSPTDPRGCMAMWGDSAPRLDGRPGRAMVTVTMPLDSPNARIALGHNHITRDIKPPGACPACDAYHASPADLGGQS